MLDACAGPESATVAPPVAYRSEVIETSGSWFYPERASDKMIVPYRGYQGRVMFGDEVAATTDTFTGRGAKGRASMAGANLRRRYQHHLNCTGLRFEVEQREKRETEKKAREDSLARRRALRAEAPQLWHALKEACSAHCPDARRAELWELVMKHQQAVIDIEAEAAKAG